MDRTYRDFQILSERIKRNHVEDQVHPIRVDKTGSEKSVIIFIPFQTKRIQNELAELLLGRETPRAHAEGDETNQYCDQNGFPFC